jgi:hypothetical protein
MSPAPVPGGPKQDQLDPANSELSRKAVGDSATQGNGIARVKDSLTSRVSGRQPSTRGASQ